MLRLISTLISTSTLQNDHIVQEELMNRNMQVLYVCIMKWDKESYSELQPTIHRKYLPSVY